MINKLFAQRKEDICPNCGTACFATDVLCPQCGGNLDELFEQLPNLKEESNVPKIVAKFLRLSTWPALLLILLSPLFVSLVTVLSFALSASRGIEIQPLELILYTVPSSVFNSSIALAVVIVPLSLLTIRPVKMKIGKRLTEILAIVLTIYAGSVIWTDLQSVNYLSAWSSYAYIGLLVQLSISSGDPWVYSVSAICTVLLGLILLNIFREKNTA